MPEERKRKRQDAPAPAAVRVEISVAPSPPPPPPPARGATTKKRSKPAKKKKLTAKGRKAVVLDVMASVEAQKIAAGPTAVPAVAPPPPPPNAAPSPEDAAATAKHGKAWSKEDVATLARLVEDPGFLKATIPTHPPGPDLDWESISRHFGRWSKGGTAVRHQYYSIVRLMKQARREGRRGACYVDMVRETQAGLPGGAGTVYEVQAALKKGPHAKFLDKYKEKGQTRWKKAVGECLREESGLFENSGKNAAGKIIWKLKPQTG